jgi:hypothetical protein
MAWLPWAALGAIVAVVLLSLLAVQAVDGRPPADGPEATRQAGHALRAGEQDLAGLAAGGSLSGVVGQPVTGTATVESVVSDEGFWVGSGATDRVFVHLTAQARRSGGKSGFRVGAGQTVQLQGTAVPIAEVPDALAGVEAAEGLEQLRAHGVLVRADRVALAG